MLSENLQKRLEKYLLRQEEKKRKERAKNRKKKKVKKEVVKESITGVLKKEKKRKVGRPKKRGPKKKRIRRKIIKEVKARPLINFKIISSLNGKQNGHIGQYYTYTDAFNKLMELDNDNRLVVFPRRFLNSGKISVPKDEYLLLEKNRDGNKSDGMLRNEFGKIVCHKIKNNNKWVIRDKIVRQIEETFWVYGYCPKTDRKTYTWIYENLIIGGISNPYDVIRVLVYKNKLVIKYDEKPMVLVMCKNKSDCIRMYNLISEDIRKVRNKQVMCVGSYNLISDKRRELEEELIELTGWTRSKIQRSTN